MKFIDTTALTLALLGLAPSAVLAVCADGEVAIGRQMIYNIGTPQSGPVLGSDNYVIIANNCNTIAVSDRGFQNDACSAGPRYGNGYSVTGCDGNGKPGLVVTTGGNFNNCYRNTGGYCATGPWFFKGAEWCCKRSTWA
ncbi:hypothetical protein QBC41DRAFT_100350 [Cercophora samala]|uniref:Uncharacterized protein n=1 Tax=Cercophora samala TaxID=330535 RepID=A0AA39ZF49_9PEZI|nr:hypothetical protein QBC41DRAFT_100350 [Cercophora samala]